MSKITEAYILANDLLEKSQSSSDDIKFRALAAKIRSIGVYGKSEWILAMDYIKSADRIFDRLNETTREKIKLWRAEILCDKGILQFMFISDKLTAIASLQQSFDLYEELGDQRGMGYARAWIAMSKYVEGKPDEAMKVLGDNLIQTHAHQIWDAKLLTIIFEGSILDLLGDEKTAIQKGEETVSLALEYNLKWWEGESRFYLGTSYASNGRYEQAIDEFKISLKISRELGDKHIEAKSLCNLADIERRLGDIDLAIDKLEESRLILEDIQDVNCLMDVNFKLAKALTSKNAYEKAYHLLVRCLELGGATNEQTPHNVYYYPETLLELIIVSKELGKDKEVDTYLNYLESFASTHPSEKFNFQLNLAKALVEKKGTRVKHKVSSQNRLEKLVAHPIEIIELNVRAIINYCELLIVELETYGEEEVLDEIIGLSQKLNDMAESQKLYPLKIESLLLEGKLRLIEGEVKMSLDRFNQAYEIASQYNLHQFEQKASELMTNIDNELEKWEILYHDNISLIERVKQSQISRYINEVIKLADLQEN
ncbi:MAG: tetratricopeptide repeat protein [Candidatus Kariarchaeaceae archaeon]